MCLRELRVQGLLSFGPQSPKMEFGPLNVLIGPNASGKSNLIEVLALLRDTPEFSKTPRSASEWLWRGETERVAELAAVTETGQRSVDTLRYAFRLKEDEDALAFNSERLERVDGTSLFRSSDGRQQIHDPRSNRLVPVRLSKFRPSSFSPRSRLFGHRSHPAVALLADTLQSWRLYRQWELGLESSLRSTQRTALRRDHLQEDARNLGLVLKRLQSAAATRAALLARLRELYPGAEDVDVRIDEDWGVLLFVKEAGRSVPATRLSDGTLHWLCLLAILLDPTPPPLVCIEEPEVGLHPDLLHVLVDLLRAASERTQIFVTTHSEVLVDALSDTPEAVMVCERSESGTTLRRLSRDKLRIWLGKYSLGELWTKGEFGGTRW